LSLVLVNHLSVQFGQRTILTDVHLIVRRGEIVTLIGPNGAGKSTLVKVVLGLIQPHKGTVALQADIRMGYMPQGLSIEPFMPLSVHRFLQLTANVSTKALNIIIDELTIRHLLAEPMQSISGGERQRVLLARALLRRPDLLVLDEPVQGVDVTGQEELHRLIMHIRDTYHCGILMVSHDLYLVMAGTDSVICLNKHVCCSGSPAAVSQHPEFLNLFGTWEPGKLAVYAHQHNHKHDLGGDICT
jgi:zinc transport system ATP-binding protein